MSQGAELRSSTGPDIGDGTSAAAGAAPSAPARGVAPPVPESIEDTGLSRETISDLLLKILYVQGARTGDELQEHICLPFALVDDELLDLQQRRFLEVRGTSGHGRGGYTFDLTAGGRERAREALSSNQYAGPAPVPLEQYREWVERQSVRDVHVTRQRIREGFDDMVLHEQMFEMLGPAVNSAKSLFLYGEPGNGKTVIAETIARLLGEQAVYIPRAVEIEGQIMVLHDPVHHRPYEDAEEDPVDAEEEDSVDAILLRKREVADRRFARVKRPVVITGGELTLDQLDLQYDQHTKMYQAPFQVKANGGVLIIDDFGRQRVPPRDLLNRWIVPLEKRRDYLTLHTGGKFPIPFDCLLVFATNLDPTDLVEEAFLRRIHYKIEVPSPTKEEYAKILKRVCEDREMEYEPRAVEYLFKKFYNGLGIEPRGCHPRDITDHLCDFARYQEREAKFTPDLIDPVCHSYFLVMAPDAMAGA